MTPTGWKREKWITRAQRGQEEAESEEEETD